MIRTLDERLVWLTALDSRRHEVTASVRSFTGHLIVGEYAAYQKLLTGAESVLARIQQNY